MIGIFSTFAVALALMAPQTSPTTKNGTVVAQPRGTSDGRGHVWTPDGKYSIKKLYLDAVLDSSGGESKLDAGNGCIMTGRLTPIAGKPAWLFTATGADGIACPDVPGPGATATITTLNGPAVNAAGNASKISIAHKGQKGRQSFSGVYTFVSE